MDFNMKWPVKPCKLTDETIEAIKGLPESSYNPFDHYNGKGERELYLQFTAIDDNNPNDIFKFISTYGFLGFGNDKELRHQEELKRVEGIHKKLEEAQKSIAVYAVKAVAKNPFLAPDLINFLGGGSNNAVSDNPTPKVNETPEDYAEQFRQYVLNLPPESERLEDIQREIRTMRFLVMLWEEIRSKRREGVLEQLANLYHIKYRSRYKDKPIKELDDLIAELTDYSGRSDDIVYFIASRELSEWVNEKLTGVHPVLNYSIDVSNYSIGHDNSFTGSWFASHLLSAMYVMFYMDLTRGVILRKCQNQTCKEFFSIYGNDERKIYCSESCASSQKQRDYRRRKKEKDQKLQIGLHQ